MCPCLLRWPSATLAAMEMAQVAQPVPLHDDERFKPMPAEAALAYDAWLRDYGMRILTTADALGIPRRTIRTWAERYQWRQRARALALDEEDAALESDRLFIHRMRHDALKAAAALLADPDGHPVAKARVIQTILDRTGLPPTRHQITEHVDATAAGYTEAQLVALAQSPDGVAALLALSRRSGGQPVPDTPALPDVVDADPDS